ncbi:MAG TPA: protein kinase [Anaeromyxobacteraceae bacterium]|nr:protein kinase [Anaeromyxobacteraceae bacterium]
MTQRPKDPAFATLPCVRCGYLADTSTGPLNFCPQCGLDLRAGLPPDPDPTTSAWLGQVIAERYRLTALLGEGGMGAVFRAEHVRMGKALAVKLLRGGFARDRAAAERFQAEARIVSRLSHPHTIAVFDFGDLGSGEGFYLAMEYVAGKDLAAVLREQGRLPEPRAASIAEQLLDSLSEAHGAGIVHRDVKPANVMLAEAGGADFVKVLDFGIAKLRDAAGGGSDTTRGAIIGTPSYLAPEQARGEEIDARADLYAVGALLYELVSGRCPFVSRSPMAVVQAHLTQQPPPLRLAAPWVSEELAAVVHRALEKEPGRRFQSAAEMRRALLALPALARQGARPGPPPPREASDLANRADFEEFESQMRRLRRGGAAAPVAVALALLLGAAAVWRWPAIQPVLERGLSRAVRLLPASLRPADRLGGRVREPGEAMRRAIPLVLPPGPDGRPAGGPAVVRGRLGGDAGGADVYRLEVPDSGRARVLVAEWGGAAPGEGIPGVAVALALNRDGGGAGRPAPLVAQSAPGAPGRPQRLAALVEPGVHYLAVRELRAPGAAPAERPAAGYRLRVLLADPVPGEELEPDDDPGPAERRYPQWRALAERNPLGEGGRIEGQTAEDDADTFSVAPRGEAGRPELVAAIPAPDLALTAQLWLPDPDDLDPAARGERERFAEAGQGEPGELVVVRLDPPPDARAPALVRLRALSGEGAYQILALGPGSASGALVRARVEALAAAGQGPQALELAAAYARGIPEGAGRTAVLAAAGRLAERLAPSLSPLDLRDYERASRRLGLAVFEPAAGGVRYGSAFESLAEGSGGAEEEALFRAASRVLPCTPDEVRRRAEAFLSRFPRSPRAPAARLQLARALEEQYWQGGGRAALQRAIGEYAIVARGRGAGPAEAAERASDLAGPRPSRPAVSRLRCD